MFPGYNLLIHNITNHEVDVLQQQMPTPGVTPLAKNRTMGGQQNLNTKTLHDLMSLVFTCSIKMLKMDSSFLVLAVQAGCHGAAVLRIFSGHTSASFPLSSTRNNVLW